MTNSNLDEVVLAIIKGCDIAASIKRLYRSGDITDTMLAACVGKYITLPEYNNILGID